MSDTFSDGSTLRVLANGSVVILEAPGNKDILNRRVIRGQFMAERLVAGLTELAADMLGEYGTAASGNWGHAGVAGQLGGSAPGGGGGRGASEARLSLRGKELESRFGMPMHNIKDTGIEEKSTIETALGRQINREVVVLSHDDMDKRGIQAGLNEEDARSLLGEYDVVSKQIFIREEAPQGTVAHETLHAAGLTGMVGDSHFIEGVTQAAAEDLIPQTFKVYARETARVRDLICPIVGMTPVQLAAFSIRRTYNTSDGLGELAVERLGPRLSRLGLDIGSPQSLGRILTGGGGTQDDELLRSLLAVGVGEMRKGK